jgi:pyruvate dehydrogenase E2 component (dihydrolipoamide acetyltransferase)
MGRDLPTDFMDPPGDLGLGAQPGRVLASPLARRIASDLGVDLQRVQGSAAQGRIVRADVEAAAKAQPTSSSVSRPDDVVRNTPMRKTIARRLLASHQDIPTFFLTTTFDMQAFVTLRGQLKRQLPDLKVSYNDILIAAVARALRDYPKANASWADNEITYHGRVDIGVAVALPDGLITPVIRGADQQGLEAIASDVRALAGRARDGKLTPEEYTGSTFTISNLGMFGIDHFTAIINPPEAAILAVGKLAQEPVVVDGELTTGWRMKVTMTCDHRVIDGAVGAEFLKVLQKYVESPYLLLV